MYGKSGNPSSRLSLFQKQEKQTLGKLNETIAERPMQTTIAAEDDHAMHAHIHPSVPRRITSAACAGKQSHSGHIVVHIRSVAGKLMTTHLSTSCTVTSIAVRWRPKNDVSVCRGFASILSTKKRPCEAIGSLFHMQASPLAAIAEGLS
jgi:site-specific DNA-cytosine methylase